MNTPNTTEQSKTFPTAIEGKNLMFLRDISIWLDNYDDIFSDFDPRPYSERALSDDFLTEIRKVSREREEKINEIKLLMPGDKRNNNDETIIIKKLHMHIKKNYHQYEEQYRKLWKKGIIFFLIGIIFMLIASYISALQSNIFLVNIALVLFEPSGWFFVWSGLDIIFFSSKQQKKELEFYSKLLKSKIIFLSI